MIRVAYSLLVLLVVGLLLFGAVVSAAFAMQYFGSFGGIVGFATVIVYMVVVGLPVAAVLHLLGLKIK